MIVLIGAEKGGVGKTSLAVNMAAIAVSQGIDTLLLDTDSTGSATAWCRIRKEEFVEPNIPLLAMPENPIVELGNLAPRYELIIIDIGARNYNTLLQAALLADVILVPATAGQFELESTFNLFDAFAQLAPRHKAGKIPAWVVLNQLPTNSRSKEEKGLRAALEESGIPVMQSILRNRKAWRDSSRSGRGLHELLRADFDPKAEAEMRELYAEAESLV